jgi:6-phosphofructokinase 2
VARAIKILGGAASAVYVYGGLSGRMLDAMLERQGIDRLPVVIEGMTREDFMAMETATGHQFRFNLPGPSLTCGEIENIFSLLAAVRPAPDFIVASGSLPPNAPADLYARLALFARDSGSFLVLDTSGEPLRCALEQGATLIKPNRRELEELSGTELQGENELRQATQALLASGKTRTVVVSLGPAGALFADRERYERIPNLSIPVKSKVGAGDSMVGGLVYMLALGEPMEAAVRYGMAAGMSAVMRPGTELCRKEDTDRLYHELLQNVPGGKILTVTP